MLYQIDAEILFPSHAIPALRSLRGDEWTRFIDGLSIQDEGTPDVLAFGLLMMRLNGCVTCRSDSYRAMQGCVRCATQIVTRFKGEDRELIERWHLARTDVLAYLAAPSAPVIEKNALA